MSEDLISRQAAIDAMWKALYAYQCLTEKQFMENDELDLSDWFEHRIFVQRIHEECLNAVEALPSADVPDTNVREWISCSDRLPYTEKKRYWICTNSGYQCQCRWTNVNHFWTDLTTDWHWHIMDIPQHTKVVAWMPLPPVYKGVDNEND